MPRRQPPNLEGGSAIAPSAIGLRNGLRARTVLALLVAALGSLALALAATPAGAASWLAPLDLSAGDHAFSPQVAVDPEGNATAVWRSHDGSNYIVQSSTRPAGGEWSEPVDLSAAGQEAEQPQVAVDPQGNATAVWRRFDGSNYIVQSSTRPAGGEWSESVDLSAAGEDADEPQVAVDPQGNATAVWWWADEGSNFIVESSTRPAGGEWSEPVNLTTIYQWGKEPHVAIDPQGNATAVWHHFGDGWDVIRSSGHAPGGEWSEPVDLSTEGVVTYTEEPQVAVDPQGNATAVWWHRDPSNQIVESSTRPTGGEWSEPVDVSAAGQWAYEPQVAVDPEGNATAVWRRFDGSNYIVQSSTRPAGGEWSEPVDLSAAGQEAKEPQVAVDPQGNATAVWSRYDGSKYVVQSSTRPAGGEWTQAGDISAGQYAYEPQVAVDPEGNATAVWRRFPGCKGCSIVEAAGYDAAAPRLNSLSIPTGGIAGQPVSFSVSPLDVWSAVTTSWRFGDGGSATGASVTHTFAAAATYEVTVTSTDALGYSSNAAATIAIGAAPPASTPARGRAYAARLVRVKRGRALVRLRCRRGGRCWGVVKLRAHRKLIGKRRFGIAAGKTKVVRVALRRPIRELLGDLRRHRYGVGLSGRGVKNRRVLLKQG